MSKPYDVGAICGRFQTFHIGHESLVDTALKLCDRVLILVGSSQECGTERNPLNIDTRIRMLRAIYGDDGSIIIKGISDLTDEMILDLNGVDTYLIILTVIFIRHLNL